MTFMLTPALKLTLPYADSYHYLCLYLYLYRYLSWYLYQYHYPYPYPDLYSGPYC